MNLTKFLSKIGTDNSGATAVEYGLIAALIVIAAVGGFQLLGDSNSTGWGSISDRVEEVMG